MFVRRSFVRRAHVWQSVVHGRFASVGHGGLNAR